MVHDSLVFFSGIAPFDVTGVVGADLSVEQGYEVAGTLALMAMRRIVDAFGTLDAVDRWIKVLGFVRSAPGFGDQPAVVNGFSDRVIEVYGTERGRCAALGDRLCRPSARTSRSRSRRSSRSGATS